MQRNVFRIRQNDILPAMRAVSKTVKDLAEGKIDPVLLAPKRPKQNHAMRYAPSFVPSLTVESGHPYTASALAAFLGSTVTAGRKNQRWRKASPVVEVALNLLELRERGEMSAEVLQRIAGMPLKYLLKLTRNIRASSPAE
jgi:hypothetical protein